MRIKETSKRNFKIVYDTIQYIKQNIDIITPASIASFFGIDVSYQAINGTPGMSMRPQGMEYGSAIVDYRYDSLSQVIILAHEIGHQLFDQRCDGAAFFDAEADQLNEFYPNLFTLMLMPELFTDFEVNDDMTIEEVNKYVFSRLHLDSAWERPV